jgi:hypothetical protein
VTHYEVLSVGPAASPEEVRRAYLRMARRHHPDLARGDDQRLAAEDEMRAVNAAWSVLGDPRRRAAYDRSLGADAADRRRPWQPLDPDDLDDDEEVDPHDLLDDEPVGDGGLPGAVQLAGPLLVGGGLIGVILGSFTAIPGLLALGSVALVLGGLTFLAMPFVAVHRSRRGERSGGGPGGAEG